MALFKPGQSGNKNGRPKGSKNAMTRASQEILQLNDLEMTRKFLRAVIVSDKTVLADFGVDSVPSATAKISAAKELAKINAELVAKDKEMRDARREKRSNESQSTVKAAPAATFQAVATLPFKKSGTK